ncbi:MULTISPECIES: TetR/AcrR family transcriptional regulator [unclassified Herbaspirillum]|uniref:TetR/AcrR family transcriptional regulator n=2 Tax=Herbaspirillum TaxID=963 RepID=UPI000E2F3CB1|nr:MULTISPECIES: TetR/AcrR family transcriptional regulator [unclassified Herbaspirillum]RFB69745.1 TetR/AcrR family transcriptional regulator [Herbaspirillum sp. 3R-3a1]TFI07193.1 TetR/AcrR family transcriptional regulator [Herbaspirillum sp. 3R11]TFI13130.1 TetR/AcrR family transcriptional regulator [Herbaspirillum sp. 3R-11]TFI19644.1 TetR/AcrR family transcriptional regulator [Herbaspirillum sp. 3C11]
MTSSETSMTPSRSRGRPREFDIDAALDKAIVIFSERGYYGTSIADLSSALELTAGSIYKAFDDKRAVFVAALERYITLRTERLQQALQPTRTGRERVRTVLALYAASSYEDEGRRGCLIVSSAVELAMSDPEIAERVARSLDLHEKRLTQFIRQGQDDGSIPAHVEATVTARLLLCVLQGMRVIGKTGRGKKEMNSLIDKAMKVLD